LLISIAYVSSTPEPQEEKRVMGYWYELLSSIHGRGLMLFSPQLQFMIIGREGLEHVHQLYIYDYKGTLLRRPVFIKIEHRKIK